MNKAKKNHQIVQNFMNLCATMIQANFKGYMQRKYYQKFLPVYRRFKQLLYAGFMGWKTRKVLKLSLVKSKINEIKTLKKQEKNMQVRIAKRDFSDEISKLFKNGLWIFYLLKQRKPLQSTRSSSLTNSNINNQAVKTNLKQVLKIIPKSNDKKSIVKQKQDTDTLISIKLAKPVKNKEKQAQKKDLTQKSKQKEPKYKKFQAPPKQSYKLRKIKQPSLEIQTTLVEPQVSDPRFSQCQTPSQFLHQSSTQMIFRTKPRQQNPVNDKGYQHKQGEHVFRDIQVMNYSSRKGLNMTLSKKYTSGKKQQEIHKIDHNVLYDFSKLKDYQLQTEKSPYQNCESSSLSTNDVAPLNEIQRPEYKNSSISKVVQKMVNKRSLLDLDLRKQDFERRKQELEKRSKQFKKAIV